MHWNPSFIPGTKCPHPQVLPTPKLPLWPSATTSPNSAMSQGLGIEPSGPLFGRLVKEEKNKNKTTDLFQRMAVCRQGKEYESPRENTQPNSRIKSI